MKKTTNFKALAAAAITAAIALSSCVKDDLYNTSHPDYGKIIITPDWSARGEDVPVPSSWTLTMGDYTGAETGTTHSPDYLFDPGTYTLVVWNPSDHITVSGTTATVAEATTTAESITVDLIENTPGWLMTNVQELAIIKDSTHTRTAVMEQQVRQLTVTIEPTGDAADLVTGIEAYLTGVAGSMDFATDTYGSVSNVELDFSQITDGTDAGKWTATVRLLGITGSEQRLVGTVRFADNNPLDMPLDSDLTSSLSGFNDAKNTPISIGGTMATLTEAGFTATITDWTENDNGNIDIH